LDIFKRQSKDPELPARERVPEGVFSPQIMGWFLCVEVWCCVVTRCWRSGGRRWMGSVRGRSIESIRRREEITEDRCQVGRGGWGKENKGRRISHRVVRGKEEKSW